MVVLVALNLALGLGLPRIDDAAHLGGLAAGVALGAGFDRSGRRMDAAAQLLVAVLVVAAAVGVAGWRTATFSCGEPLRAHAEALPERAAVPPALADFPVPEGAEVVTAGGETEPGAEESAGAYLLARLDRDDALGALHWFTAALPPAGYEVVATATLSRPDETGASRGPERGPEGVGASYEVEFRRGEDLTGNMVLTPLPAHAGDGARAVQILVRTERPSR